MGGPILAIYKYTSVTCFLERMSLLGVLLIMLPIYGVKSPRNLQCGGVNRNKHFQAKHADYGWIAVCCLAVDRFLLIACEMLSAGGS